VYRVGGHWGRTVIRVGVEEPDEEGRRRGRRAPRYTYAGRGSCARLKRGGSEVGLGH